MKAVIVIDVDEEDIGREVNYISVKGGGISYIIGAKNDNVLIRQLPFWKEITGKEDFSTIAFRDGWNHCLYNIGDLPE